MTVLEPYYRFSPAEGGQLIEVELPGVQKQDIHLNVRDGDLQLVARKFSGNDYLETESQQGPTRVRPDGAETSRVEDNTYVSHTRYETVFRLPAGVDESEISSVFKDGVLKITIQRHFASE